MIFRRAVRTPGYLVLGMHRSGTSCLTGLLETAGLATGDVSRRNKHNAKGNLEDASVRAINGAILRRCGGSWSEPPPRLDPRAVPRRRIRAALAPYRKLHGWVIKDPRMLLTLEAWLPYLDDCRFVGTFRDPLAVARSLQARGGISLDRGVALWTHYNDRLERLHRARRFPLLRFGGSRESYLGRFAVLCAGEGLAFDADRSEAFYDDSLVHASADGSRKLPERTRSVLEYLRRHEVTGAGVAQPGC
jgi:hypothetical protein